MSPKGAGAGQATSGAPCGPRLGASAAALLAAVLLLAIFAPVLWSADASAIDTFAILQGPSARHWLGTNNLGQDVFYRVLVATRLSVGLAAGGDRDRRRLRPRARHRAAGRRPPRGPAGHLGHQRRGRVPRAAARAVLRGDLRRRRAGRAAGDRLRVRPRVRPPGAHAVRLGRGPRLHRGGPDRRRVPVPAAHPARPAEHRRDRSSSTPPSPRATRCCPSRACPSSASASRPRPTTGASCSTTACRASTPGPPPRSPPASPSSSPGSRSTCSARRWRSASASPPPASAGSAPPWRRPPRRRRRQSGGPASSRTDAADPVLRVSEPGGDLPRRRASCPRRQLHPAPRRGGRRRRRVRVGQVA